MFVVLSDSSYRPDPGSPATVGRLAIIGLMAHMQSRSHIMCMEMDI